MILSDANLVKSRKGMKFIWKKKLERILALEFTSYMLCLEIVRRADDCASLQQGFMLSSFITMTIVSMYW